MKLETNPQREQQQQHKWYKYRPIQLWMWILNDLLQLFGFITIWNVLAGLDWYKLDWVHNSIRGSTIQVQGHHIGSIDAEKPFGSVRVDSMI